jgi:hypothetical protein
MNKIKVTATSAITTPWYFIVYVSEEVPVGKTIIYALLFEYLFI